MEALVAVGLAGNVVQFVQFPSSLISEMHSVRKTGKPSALADFQKLSKTVVDQAVSIQQCLKSSTKDLGKEEKDLIRVAEDCENAGQQFLEWLESITATSSRFSLMKNLKTTVKYQLAQHKLEEFTARLDRFQNALLLGTTIALRTVENLNHQEVLQALQKLHTGEQNLQSRHKLEKLIKETELCTQLRLEKLHLHIETCVQKVDSLCADLPQARRREEAVLTWLDFRQMSWRYDAVSAACQKTFEWIFKPPQQDDGWCCFNTYLERDNGLPYFINGKAGSGKSTLMKFIVEHPNTESALNRWAGPDGECVVLNFFFWDAGTEMQKTVEGMLRALLHSALTSHPELIAVVFPKEFCHKWASHIVDDLPGQPEFIEVRKAFDQFLKKTSNTLKVAIFVDGLDEFRGDHKEVAQWFLSIVSQHCHVKAVISSRPINAAIKVFRSSPTLNLHDLTKHDMKLFITGHLDAHDGMRALSTYFPKEAQELIAEIQNKAQGVFLWVRLVVGMLLDGLEAGDDLGNLQQKLHSLPAGLREIYTRMLSRLSPEYKIEAAKIFQLIQTWNNTCSGPFTTVGLYYGLQPPTQVMSVDARPLDARNSRFFYENAEARIRTRCCGLLELHHRGKDKIANKEASSNEHGAKEPTDDQNDLEGSTIDYLHRTVKEFLSSQDVLEEIRAMTQYARFEPFENLISACVMTIKLSGRPIPGCDQIAALYRQAYHISPVILRPYMDALDVVMSGRRMPNDTKNGWHLVNRRTPFGDISCGHHVDSLQSFAASEGLSRYLEEFYCSKGPVSCDEQLSILERATSSLDRFDLSLQHRRDTLLFILAKVVSPQEKERIFQMLAQVRRRMTRKERDPEEHATFYAICLLTGLPVKDVIGCTVRNGTNNDTSPASSVMSFIHFYTSQNAELCPSRLRTLSLALKASNDPESQSLGDRLVQISMKLKMIRKLNSDREVVLEGQSIDCLLAKCISLAEMLGIELEGVVSLSQIAENLLHCKLRLTKLSECKKEDLLSNMYIADTASQLDQIETQILRGIFLAKSVRQEYNLLERLREAYTIEAGDDAWVLV